MPPLSTRRRMKSGKPLVEPLYTSDDAKLALSQFEKPPLRPNL